MVEFSFKKNKKELYGYYVSSLATVIEKSGKLSTKVIQEFCVEIGFHGKDLFEYCSSKYYVRTKDWVKLK